MTLRHMRIFTAVYREGSVTAAAQKLYIAQPTVSIALRELEEYYGHPLFERLGRKLQITEFGRLVYQYATHIMSLYNELEHISKDLDRENTIFVGTGPAIGEFFMPDIVKNFRQSHANIKIHVTVDRTYDYSDELINNKLDFAIVERMRDVPGIACLPIRRAPIVAVCHRDHPLAQMRTVAAEDLIRCELLVTEKESYTRKAVDAFFSAHNLQIAPTWVSIDIMTLINAVRNNLGVSFLALDHIRTVSNDELVLLNVEGLSAWHYINVYYHKDKRLTPAMREFINFFSQNYPSPAQGEKCSSALPFPPDSSA